VDINKLSCQALHQTFIGASELVRRANTSKIVATSDSKPVAASPATTSTIDYVADLNQRNKDFWARA
jgi:hypothetical protein